MATSDLTFSAFTLLIQDSEFSHSDLRKLERGERLISDAQDSPDNTKRVIISGDAPILAIYFEEGKGKPRPKKVYNKINKVEEDNPRQKNQVEMSAQTFVLINSKSQRIYISDLRKKKKIEKWLSQELNKPVAMKQVIDQKQFLESINTLKSIELGIDKSSSFRDAEKMEIALKDDPLGYGMNVKRMKLIVELEEGTLADTLKEKLEHLLWQKENKKLDKLKVIGRNDKGLEQVLNPEGIVEKTTIDAPLTDDGLYDKDAVFENLIEKIQDL